MHADDDMCVRAPGGHVFEGFTDTVQNMQISKSAPATKLPHMAAEQSRVT